MKKLNSWLLFLVIFLFFLLPPTDPDLGWHLRCGQEFWQKKSFCQENQFSVILEGYQWLNHAWLYQALIFPLYQLAGLWGLTLFNGLLMTLTFLFFYLAIKNYAWEKVISLSLITFFSWGVFSFGLRSQLMALFFFSLLFYCLKRKAFLFLPLITLGWANTHGSVIIGLVLIFFWEIKEIISQLKNWPWLSAIFLLSSATTLINPSGLRIYQEAWHHFTTAHLNRLIAEWVPPTGIVWWLIFFVGLGLFLYLLTSKRKEKILACLVPLSALSALKARRQVPFFFFLSFFLFLTSSTTKKRLSLWLRKKTLRNDLIQLSLIVLLLVGFFIRLPQTIRINHSWQNYCQASSLNFPCQAIEFLKTQPEKGNLFNRYEWGGFLIWQLPEYKILVDGRMPAWPTLSGKSPYTIYLETLQTQSGWQETLEEYKIKWLLISPNTFMDLKLRPNPKEFGWEEAYRDEISVVYKRS